MSTTEKAIAECEEMITYLEKIISVLCKYDNQTAFYQKELEKWTHIKNSISESHKEKEDIAL